MQRRAFGNLTQMTLIARLTHAATPSVQGKEDQIARVGWERSADVVPFPVDSINIASENNDSLFFVDAKARTNAQETVKDRTRVMSRKEKARAATLHCDLHLAANKHIKVRVALLSLVGLVGHTYIRLRMNFYHVL